MAVIRPERCVYYFCDESSHIDDEFMAVAGLAVPDTVVNQIRNELLEIKKANGDRREIKWSNAKERRDSPHRAFADYFERQVKDKQIHFHIRFAPFNKYDHKMSGPQRRADTTSKMHFQLLAHRALRFYGRHYKLRLRPDNGRCTEGLSRQIGNLHFVANDHYGTPVDCIEHFQCLDSSKEPLLMLLDVPLGAMTALRNGRKLDGPKAALAKYISDKWPKLDLAANSPATDKHFSVWNVVPKGAPKRGPWG